MIQPIERADVTQLATEPTGLRLEPDQVLTPAMGKIGNGITEQDVEIDLLKVLQAAIRN